MSQTHLFDVEATVQALNEKVAGKRFRGAVDGMGCIEFVFDEAENEEDWCNLVTIFVDKDLGQVAFGSIDQELIDGGYVEANSG